MKNLILLTTITSILFLTAFTLTSENQKVVVIDIGHGGKDPGANEAHAIEKEITLNIANKIKALNEIKDLQLIFTRENDEFMSVEDRVAFVEKNKPDLVVSIHANYAGSDKQGVELYYGRDSNSQDVVKHFKNKLSKSHKINKVAAAGFSIINEVSCDAIMIETVFLSNTIDR